MANGEWGVYRGTVNLNDPEDIQHWKYIKKYRTGNTWRYVYGDENTHNNISNMYSKYQSTKDNANRYKEYADKMNKQGNTSGLFKNDPNHAAAAERYKKNYYEAEAKASKSKKASPQYYKSYIASVENNSVSKILNDKIKPWKETASLIFNRYAAATKELIERKKADFDYYKAVNKSRRIQNKEDRKIYPVSLGTEIKNQIDYATHPSQWKQPYKSASTKRKEKFAADAEQQEKEFKKKYPISFYIAEKFLEPPSDRKKKHGGSSGRTFADRQRQYSTSGRNF